MFGRLAGPAEIWLDDKLVATKTDPGVGTVAVGLPPGDVNHVLAVLFDAPAGGPAFGIAGAVKVEPAP